jgi:hypothetical protein
MALQTDKKRYAGRPKTSIDWERVGQSIMMGSSATQTAASIGISVDTLYTRCKKDLNQDFTAFCQEKKASGDKLLHQTQFEVAVKNKNTSMLIWLGKQRLGQSDNISKDAQDIIKSLSDIVEASNTSKPESSKAS